MYNLVLSNKETTNIPVVQGTVAHPQLISEKKQPNLKRLPNGELYYTPLLHHSQSVHIGEKIGRQLKACGKVSDINPTTRPIEFKDVQVIIMNSSGKQKDAELVDYSVGEVFPLVGIGDHEKYKYLVKIGSNTVALSSDNVRFLLSNVKVDESIIRARAPMPTISAIFSGNGVLLSMYHTSDERSVPGFYGFDFYGGSIYRYYGDIERPKTKLTTIPTGKYPFTIVGITDNRVDNTDVANGVDEEKLFYEREGHTCNVESYIVLEKEMVNYKRKLPEYQYEKNGIIYTKKEIIRKINVAKLIRNAHNGGDYGRYRTTDPRDAFNPPHFRFNLGNNF